MSDWIDKAAEDLAEAIKGQLRSRLRPEPSATTIKATVADLIRKHAPSQAGPAWTKESLRTAFETWFFAFTETNEDRETARADSGGEYAYMWEGWEACWRARC